MKTKLMLWSRIKASAWGMIAAMILRMLLLGEARAHVPVPAHNSSNGAIAFCQAE